MLYEEVKEMESELAVYKQTVGEIRATLMVNFGPNGRVAKSIIGEEQSSPKMVETVLLFLMEEKR